MTRRREQASQPCAVGASTAQALEYLAQIGKTIELTDPSRPAT